VATSPSPTLFSHTRPAARSALPAARAGSSCGSASPAAGSPAPTTHRTNTLWPTTTRPTTPLPPHCDMVHGCVGATSINARSDSCRWIRLVACLAWDQVAGAGLPAAHSWKLGTAPVVGAVACWVRSDGGCCWRCWA